MNRIILMGRLTKDPEVRYTNTQKVVASFTLAVDRPYNGADGQKETDFINCVLWGKQGETLGNSVSKGQRVLVEGRLQIRSYDGKDGTKKYITEVVADRFEYIERKENGNNGGNYAPRQNTAPQQGSMGVFGNAYDEEIPF